MGLFTDGFKELKKASEPLYKSPKSIQETIEIMAVAENGIFEVARNRYSKCYLFQDINYTTTNEDEQIDIFERYCKFLNSLDCNYKITVNNKNKNMAELREKVMTFRRRNYEIQNLKEGTDVYTEMEQLEEEYHEIRKNPLISDYLQYELGLCRIMQRINLSLVGTVDLDIRDFKDIIKW